MHTDGSGPVFQPPVPQGIFGRATLDQFIPQPVLVSELFWLRCRILHLAPLNLLYELVQVPLGGTLSFRGVNSTTQLGVIWKLAEVVLNPSMSLMKKLSHTGPNPWYKPLTAPLASDIHPDTELVNTTLWMWASSRFLIYCIVYPLKPSPRQFRKKDYVGNHVQDLTEVQKNDICSHSLVSCRHCLIEDPWTSEAILPVPNHLPVLLSFWEGLFHALPRRRGEADRWVIPRVSLSKDGYSVSISPLSGDSTWLPWFVKYHGSCSATTSANSLWILGCNVFCYCTAVPFRLSQAACIELSLALTSLS